MLLIEMSGLPGSGKTTLIEKILEHNEFKQAVTKEVINYKLDKKRKNGRIKIFLVAFFSRGNLILNLLIVLYTLNYKIKIDRLKFAYYFIEYHYLYHLETLDEKNKIILIDEGLLQLITSIPHDVLIKKNRVYNSLIKSLRKKYHNMVFINCDIEKKIAFERINKRSEKNHRFDGKDAEGLKKLLNIKEKNIISVREIFQKKKNGISINMLNSEKSLIKEILSFIEKILKDSLTSYEGE